MMTGTELLDPFNRLLDHLATPAAIRAIEAGGPINAMWDDLEASGYLDALLPEHANGAGLTLHEVGPLLCALGYHAVPLPVAETMIGRRLLSDAALSVPSGPIVLAVIGENGTAPVPCALVADHVLLDSGTEVVYTSASKLVRCGTGVDGSMAARFATSPPLAGPVLPQLGGGLRPLAAIIRSCAIVGAISRLLEMTVEFANTRIQFGRRIAKQQAIQHQLAVMAEHMVAARLAAEAACAGGLTVNPLIVAAAKLVCGKAASEAAAIAHAVHGAIGITEECNVQLYTRRLHEWRLSDGSEYWWSIQLGSVRLASRGSSIDFVRTSMLPA
jgi:acyl-CoA dehydrogenase